jgi:hypothetical protein
VSQWQQAALSASETNGGCNQAKQKLSKAVRGGVFSSNDIWFGKDTLFAKMKLLAKVKKILAAVSFVSTAC